MKEKFRRKKLIALRLSTREFSRLKQAAEKHFNGNVSNALRSAAKKLADWALKDEK